ncbi:hypothetical protein GLOTRDRAFT_140660 [Gloeophyllum trabeum ATCC 11539]|uniref:Uncharacterized protein n=1 Tax=Gloeophyllum trabeum (strain ATCC 11539 / FP-39264 / Madison 617) TaxID=670483 RepID=S7PXE2_GLOTA|nr:uncharacterized protein GLOTRDRAFT_140660 [Gloeophyllum trabeum ATCC 11539]EPQ52276.1 hypothetical protein GLOTRDRAFT_140660 [Gloeophyllum trabeum ATCC 11539]
MAPSSSSHTPMHPRSTDASDDNNDNDGLLTHGSDIVIILLLVCALVFALEMVRGKVAAARRARAMPHRTSRSGTGSSGLPVEEEPSARRRKRAKVPPAWFEVCVAGEGEGRWEEVKPLAYRSLPSLPCSQETFRARAGCAPAFVKTHSLAPSASSTSSESSPEIEMSEMTQSQSPSQSTAGEVVVLVAMPRPRTSHAGWEEETRQLELGVARWPVRVSVDR